MFVSQPYFSFPGEKYREIFYYSTVNTLFHPIKIFYEIRT